MGRIVLLVTLSSLLGCSKGTESSNPFVTGYTSQVPSGDTDDAGTGGDDTDDPTTGISGVSASATGDGSTSTTGDTPGSTSSASTDPTAPTTDPSTSGDGSTSVASDDDGSTSTNGDGGGQNGQPPTGMYSHCIIDQYDNCINGATTCIYIEAPDDGYCSSSGCLNPAIDCDPAPADGTATPMCMSAGADSFCALDCSVGTCPAGMECKGVTFDMVTNYDICM